MRPSPAPGGNAFTLLELLVVIVIVGILAALLLPSLSLAKAQAHSATCKSRLRQMGVALKMYVDEHRNRYPHYLGPPGPAYGDAVGRGGRAAGLVYWSSKLIPYYPLNWTNSAFHCPGYKGINVGPGHFPGAIDRLGSYAYNASGARVLDNTYAKDHEHFGLGPVLYWADAPAVAEAQVKVPSEMLAIGESDYSDRNPGGIAGGQDILYCGLLMERSFATRHGKHYNQLWCDGHASGMPPRDLFNPTNNAPLWNYDHESHPELWVP